VGRSHYQAGENLTVTLAVESLTKREAGIVPQPSLGPFRDKFNDSRPCRSG